MMRALLLVVLATILGFGYAQVVKCLPLDVPQTCP